MPNNARPHARGPCATCNANGGPPPGEPDAVRCLRPGDSMRHVMRGQDQGCGAWQAQGTTKLTALEQALQRLAQRR